MDYQLKISTEQAQTLVAALEFYMRIGLGQFEMMDVHPTIAEKMYALDCDEGDRVRMMATMLKRSLFGFEANQSYGIGNRELHPSVHTAHDIHDVIRHRLAHDSLKPGEKPGWTVNFHEPMKFANEPLPTMEKIA